MGRRDANRALQAKISAIILTDFCCWVPLSIVSFLHLSEAVNASTWYPFFSILILPINSVINPLLYDSAFYFGLVSGPARVLRGTANSILTAFQTGGTNRPCPRNGALKIRDMNIEQIVEQICYLFPTFKSGTLEKGLPNYLKYIDVNIISFQDTLNCLARPSLHELRPYKNIVRKKTLNVKCVS